MTKSNGRRCEVLIAIQQALLGEVSHRVRAIITKYTDFSIHFEAYFDGEILEEDRESMLLVDTELVAMSPSSHVISHDLIRLDAPLSLPKEGIWVYHRKEPLQM